MKNEKDEVLVSVLIPVYNAEAFIRESIDSVLSQTLTDFELLLVDDGSTDKSAEIITSYTDKRIKFIPCSHDFIKTLNRGLDIAKGKYIALLDHDDIMLPYRLKTQYEYMEKNIELIGCGGFMYSFGLYSGEIKAPLNHIEIITQMIMYSIMLNPTGFIRRDFLVNNNIKYSSGYSFAADFKFWGDIVKVGKVANIPKVLTLYRTSNEQAHIKYWKESYEACVHISLELLEYFLSYIESDSQYYELLMEDFFPAIEKFGEDSLFSSKTFLPFMYELINELLKRGDIKLNIQ